MKEIPVRLDSILIKLAYGEVYMIEVRSITVPLVDPHNLTQGQTFNGSRLRPGLAYEPKGDYTEFRKRGKRRHIKRLKRELRRREQDKN